MLLDAQQIVFYGYIGHGVPREQAAVGLRLAHLADHAFHAFADPAYNFVRVFLFYLAIRHHYYIGRPRPS